jgi:hypothetical protein
MSSGLPESYFRLFGVSFVPDAVLIAVLLAAVGGWSDSATESSGAFPSVEEPLADVSQADGLSPRVRVRRAGRLLTLDFELVDPQGQRHNPGRDRRVDPPTFAVYKNSQLVGSGSFEYG